MRSKLANPTQVVVPRRVRWNAMTNSRTIGYHEKTMKQSTAPMRKPCPVRLRRNRLPAGVRRRGAGRAGALWRGNVVTAMEAPQSGRYPVGTSHGGRSADRPPQRLLRVREHLVDLGLGGRQQLVDVGVLVGEDGRHRVVHHLVDFLGPRRLDL